MKKIFYLMSICALAFVSCQKEELAGNEAADGKYTYTFTVDHTAEAKASVGDKNGTQWPVLWEKGDKIGVYDVETGKFIGTADLKDESAGKNSGTFVLTTDEVLTDGDDLYFSYPSVESAAIKAGSIAAKQSLASASSAGIGTNALAYAKAKYAKAGTKLTLTHANAYLKFNVSSSEFNGYSLEGVTLWADGSELSGAATIADDGKLTVTGAEDYVKATLKESVTVGSTAKQVWLTALPADLSGKTVYAIVHMTKGIQTVTLPVKLKGAGALKANSVTEITLPALTKSLAPSWYEPVETRYIAAYGEGWSYGPENTVLFTKKGEAKTVELKARGNFMKVKEPKYVQIYYSSDQSASQTTGYVKYGGTTESYVNGAHIEHKIADDYSVNIAIGKVYSADVNGQISAMLVKDADKNVIWGVNLWACFNEVKTVQYQNGAVMTYNIGSSVDPVKYANWKCNGVYFQWGRPFPLAWDNNITNVNKELVTENTTFEYTLTKPYTFFYYNSNPFNWFWDNDHSNGKLTLKDLWGNPDGESKSGVKSIYDPCPKGYRVVSPAVIAEVEDNLVSKVVTTTKPYYVSHNDVTWSFAGGFAGTRASNDTPSKFGNQDYMCAYWSNSNKGNNGRMMSYQPSAEEGKKILTDRAPGAALPIRCMVDTENR